MGIMRSNPIKQDTKEYKSYIKIIKVLSNQNNVNLHHFCSYKYIQLSSKLRIGQVIAFATDF